MIQFQSTHLASRLIEAQMMPQLLFADSTGGVNLVAEDKERNLGEFLNGEEGVELGLGFAETFEVSTVNEEDNAVDFGEVVTPEAAS